ncbi:MAG TPA: beta-ketoacyl-[acyl-carrier-protein] synthase family protein [Planctomycetota bacterium]|nr:beta-ketoacyl-[acyl-carrier-protein] synthase family protein [Planctomycetota bacterium]
MERRRVVLTGMGLLTPFGVGIEPLWDALVEGRSAVRPAEGFDNADMPTTHYAQLPAIDFDAYLDPKRAALWSRLSRLAVTGGILAARDAGGKVAGDRTGVILGTGYGCTYEFEEQFQTFFTKGWKRIKPISVPRQMPNAPASHLGIEFGAKGINFTVSTACSSGAISTALAVQQIRAGAIDACFTGGADYIVNASTAAVWNALRVLAKRNGPDASRPFSADRDGLVLGEGCGILLLEEREAALARGARIHAEVTGVGMTNDATNIVGPDVGGETAAVRAAIADAGLSPKDIDYVNAHGTATDANDANETTVLKEALGARAREIPVSSLKGHLGHTMGAAGAIEIAATALSLERQRVPPTLFFVPGDPACDLDYVPKARDHRMRHALTNSFGFGGQNAVLVLSRA